MYMRAVSITAACSLLAARAGDPPEAELTHARAAMVEAQAADAGSVAPERLTSAQEKLAKARLLAEDGEYDDARILAGEARAEANAALAAAKESQAETAEIELTAAQVEYAALEARLAEMEARQTERGYVVTLGDVLFETDSAALTPAGVQRVARVASYLRADPGVAVVIEGHADARGAAGYNQGLSEARAETVATALLAEGIATPRIVYTGLGESSPIASITTPLGRQLNRRVEVIFVDRG